MKTSLLRSLAGTLVACSVLLFGMNLLAGPAASGDLLRQAYRTLEQADHDYKGHRVAAMKHIEAAGKALGVNVRGDGRGHEKQGVSDAQLAAAQGLLEQARAGLTGKPLRQVNKAINELSTALKIK
jgi:hypothetical protein